MFRNKQFRNKIFVKIFIYNNLFRSVLFSFEKNYETIINRKKISFEI